MYSIGQFLLFLISDVYFNDLAHDRRHRFSH